MQFSKANIELVIAHFIEGHSVQLSSFGIGAFLAVISRTNKLTRYHTHIHEWCYMYTRQIRPNINCWRCWALVKFPPSSFTFVLSCQSYLLLACFCNKCVLVLTCLWLPLKIYKFYFKIIKRLCLSAFFRLMRAPTTDLLLFACTHMHTYATFGKHFTRTHLNVNG